MPTVAVSTGFPQVANNRTMDEWATELLDYVGGTEDPVYKAKAIRAIRKVVQDINQRAWRFNLARQEIELESDVSEYTLNADFSKPHRVKLATSAGIEKARLARYTYQRFLDEVNTSSGSSPSIYAIMNEFGDGKVKVDPFPGDTIQYPLMHVYYFSRVIPIKDGKLSVPMDFEAVLFQMSLVEIKDKVRARVSEADREAAKDALTLAASRWEGKTEPAIRGAGEG